MDLPTREEAVAALAELEAGRRAVVDAEARGLPVLLTSCSALVFADYAAKDFFHDRRAKRDRHGHLSVVDAEPRTT